MKIHAQPKPLHEPLAGGTQGATVTIEPLIGGRVHWPLELMERPGGRFESLKLLRKLLAGTDSAVPCPAFLIRHPSAGAILVDTGLHPSITSDPKENFGSLGVRFSKPELAPGEDVPAQLRRRGIDPAQVPIVVMTHLHYDHASAISEFPQSTFIVSETEWVAATTDRRRPCAATAGALRLRVRLPHHRLQPRNVNSYATSAGPSTSSATLGAAGLYAGTAPGTRA
jgi:glyoxylase-like metal-dependent hydrolase (beta-lactamase superfamily II)